MPKLDKGGNDLSSDCVFIVQQSLFGAGWCCAPKHMSAAEVQAALDEQCEAYLPAMGSEPATPWTVCPRQHSDPKFVSPGVCTEDCDRQHWFMLGGATAVFISAISTTNRLGLPKGLKVRMTFEDEYEFDESAGYFTEEDIAAEAAAQEQKDATIN